MDYIFHLELASVRHCFSACVLAVFTTMSFALFPEELLEAIVECVAFDKMFIERQLSIFRWKYASEKLTSLSLVNRQLWRLCFPFLFAHVHTYSKDLERLIDQCVSNKSFAMSIRYIVHIVQSLSGS